MRFSVKRIFDLTQLVLLFFAVYWLSSYIASEDIVQWLSEINIYIFFLVLAQRLLPYLFLGYRFSILSREKISVPRAVAGEIMCVGFNNILPARVGEILKLFYFRRLSKLTFTKLIAYVFVERITDVFFLIAIGTVITFNVIPRLYTYIFIGIMLTQLLIITDRKYIILKLSLFLLKNNFRSIIRIALYFYSTVRSRVYIKALGASSLIWIMNLMHTFLLSYFLLKLNIPISDILLLFVIVFSAGLFPIPGGIGVVDAGIYSFMTVYLNIQEQEALKTAFFSRFFYSLPAIVGMVLTIVEYLYRDLCVQHIGYK